MYINLLATLLVTVSIGACIGQTDVGAGTLYKLEVVEDVFLERPTSNYNSYQWLIVGAHPGYPKKRSLIKFQNVPSACQKINHAMMYLYYQYSHKASWQLVNDVPFITRTIQAHRVLKYWKELQATSAKRYSSYPWTTTYLGLDDTDANDCPTGHATIYAGRPSGFVEIEVTSAVKSWKAGRPNYGLLIWATNEEQNGRDTRFASKSERDSSKHPYILINCD